MTKISSITAAAIALFAMAGTANAVIILTPSTSGVTGTSAYGHSNCENTQPTNCVEDFFETSGLSLLYKDNVGGSEEGSFAASYETAFSNTSSDPSDALITYVGGASISCPECYLAIKDGNHNPAYYFYDLSAWNGTETISLSGFWPQQGAISHISIWGKPGVTVPEPSTLALFGLGLLGLAFATRRRRVN